jgi:putative toxin-antitoxin system antitoxin component (TIGR02293 family)
MIEAIRRGLPIDSLEALRKDLEISTEVMIRTIRLASRTYARRRKDGWLQPDESERLLRLGLLFDRATQVLGGTDQAREWFKTPKKALGGQAPLDYADTEPGAREVEDLLGRIEHGVFS